MTKFIFYFTFALDPDDAGDGSPGINKGFVVQADLGKSKYKDFAGFSEKLYDDIVSGIEGKYGVHDWSTGPVPGVNAIGFTTYEIEAGQIAEVMEAWRQAFLAALPSAIVGPVHTLTDKQIFNDGTVLLALEKMGKLAKSSKPKNTRLKA